MCCNTIGLFLVTDKKRKTLGIFEKNIFTTLIQRFFKGEGHFFNFPFHNLNYSLTFAIPNF